MLKLLGWKLWQWFRPQPLHLCRWVFNNNCYFLW